MNILEQLWWGNVQPGEEMDYRQEEYGELIQLYESNESCLLEMSSAEQKAVLLGQALASGAHPRRI